MPAAEFTFKRGTVLRTTRAINTKDADGNKIVIPTGTRVKAMSKTDKGLRVKVQDKALPTLKGTRLDTGYSNVKLVERGRPQPPATGTAAKKTTPKKTAAKKTTAAAKKADVVPTTMEADDPTLDTDIGGFEPIDEDEIIDLDDDADFDDEE